MKDGCHGQLETFLILPLEMQLARPETSAATNKMMEPDGIFCLFLLHVTFLVLDRILSKHSNVEVQQAKNSKNLFRHFFKLMKRESNLSTIPFESQPIKITKDLFFHQMKFQVFGEAFKFVT